MASKPTTRARSTPRSVTKGGGPSPLSKEAASLAEAYVAAKAKLEEAGVDPGTAQAIATNIVSQMAARA